MNKIAKRCLLQSVFLGGFALFAVTARAHPVFYADGWGLMFWNSPDSTESYFARTLSHRFAVGTRYFGFRNPGEFPNENYYLGQLSYLVKRWNNPASQANIYLSVAPGMASIAGFEDPDSVSFKPALYSSLEADWEDRRYYTLGKITYLEAQDLAARHYAMARVGFAPYLGEFDELNTWIILETTHNLVGSPDLEVTPLVRLFYNNFLTEIGYSFRGNLYFNLMTHF